MNLKACLFISIFPREICLVIFQNDGVDGALGACENHEKVDSGPNFLVLNPGSDIPSVALSK